MFKNWNSKKVLSSVLSLALLFSCAPTTNANSTTAGKSTSEFLENVKSVVSSPKFIVPTAIVGALSLAVATPCIYNNVKYGRPRNPIETHIKGESDKKINTYDSSYITCSDLYVTNLENWEYYFNTLDHLSCKAITRKQDRFEDDETQIDNLKGKITEILNEMNIGGHQTDFEKAIFLHDYICDHCKYPIGTVIDAITHHRTNFDPPSSNEMTACLLIGKAKCYAIAKAYMTLLKCAGVECRCIFGDGQSFGRSLGHSWNIVKINGQWYHVDVTWDLFLKATHGRYKWFMLSEEEISKDHDGFIMNKD